MIGFYTISLENGPLLKNNASARSIKRIKVLYFNDLNGKHALITGASSGLGMAFARILVAAGARVTLAARRSEPLENAAEHLRRGGGMAWSVPLDLSQRNSIGKAIGAVDRPIDILVNNAGISKPSAAEKITEEDWDAVIGTNLKGTFFLSQIVAERMRGHGGGVIVNVASILGLRVAGHVASYAASKAAVIHLTKALALEWARYRIRVNALCPGYFETNLNRDFFATDAGKALIQRIPQRRLGRLEELAVPLLLLCSNAGAYMTGMALTVDGGHLVSSL